jgi:hypothetical protein
MMVVDGCFVIELVWELLNLPTRDPDDPIFKMDWILHYVMRDLLKLENQIPYFVLEKLFEISVPNPVYTLQNLIFNSLVFLSKNLV